eukprot:COSAG01_NODE_8080_length_2929_cov_23.547350_5_plen_37_part_00
MHCAAQIMYVAPGLMGPAEAQASKVMRALFHYRGSP